MLVVGERKDAQRNVVRTLLFGIVLVAEQGPTPIDGSKEKWAGTAGVAKREAAAWCEKGGNDRRGETALAGVRCELLVEEANEFFLIEAIHKAAH